MMKIKIFASADRADLESDVNMFLDKLSAGMRFNVSLQYAATVSTEGGQSYAWYSVLVFYH